LFRLGGFGLGIAFGDLIEHALNSSQRWRHLDEYKTPQATRRLATLVLAAGEFGRPVVATPGVPSDRVKILREAFSKAVGDPDVSADVKKKKLELDPTSGEELETLAKEVITSDRAVIDRMKNLLVK